MRKTISIKERETKRGRGASMEIHKVESRRNFKYVYVINILNGRETIIYVHETRL